jgi:hypothetical protein
MAPRTPSLSSRLFRAARVARDVEALLFRAARIAHDAETLGSASTRRAWRMPGIMLDRVLWQARAWRRLWP